MYPHALNIANMAVNKDYRKINKVYQNRTLNGPCLRLVTQMQHLEFEKTGYSQLSNTIGSY